MNSYFYGLKAEEIALQHFTKQGFHPLAKRYKTPHGEVDLILKKNSILIFLEVKARRKSYNLESILTTKQISRNQAASECFLLENPHYNNYTCRLDLVVIFGMRVVEHFENIL